MGNILSRMNLLSVKVLGLFFCEDQYQKRVTILRKAGGLLSLLLLITFALFCAVLTLVRFVSFLINSSAHSVGLSFTLCTILFHFFFLARQPPFGDVLAVRLRLLMLVRSTDMGTTWVWDVKLGWSFRYGGRTVANRFAV